MQARKRREGRALIKAYMVTDMRKIMIIESIGSYIQNYTQLFDFDLKIYNSCK